MDEISPYTFMITFLQLSLLVTLRYFTNGYIFKSDNETAFLLLIAIPVAINGKLNVDIFNTLFVIIR